MMQNLKTFATAMAVVLSSNSGAHPLDLAGGVADAGPDQELCTPMSSAMMAANAPTVPGTGTWTVVSGSFTIVDAHDPSTTLTDLSVGVNIAAWTVDNGIDPAASDQVSILVYDSSAPASDAGVDQSLCSPFASTVLSGSMVIVPATGTWTLVSGSATIVDPTNRNTSITDLAVGENVLAWTVYNGDCGFGPPTADTVSIFVYDENAPAADAGPDQELFPPATSATMAGNEPVYPATGTWTVVSGTGTFDNANAPQANVSSLGVGENIFRWEIDNGPCAAGTTTDEVTITAHGQSGVEICNNGIDDDGDGLIDLNDPDCPCSTVVIQQGVEGYIYNRSFEDTLCCPYGFVTAFSPPWMDCIAGWGQTTQATADYFNMCGYHPAGFNLPSPAGSGAVGFMAFPGYFEYIGNHLTVVENHELQADTTYTISLWISTAIVNDVFSQTMEQGSYTDPFTTDQFPLAIFGTSEQTQMFPLATQGCIEEIPGWSELGRTYVQLGWEWTRVSITFTPQEDIHAFMIGGACDVPSSLDQRFVIDPVTGEGAFLRPYYVIDDLLLTRPQDQVLQSVDVSGSFCDGDIELMAATPAGSSGFQWYFNGVALPDETTSVLASSTILQLGAGNYAITSDFNGERILGSTYVSDFCEPLNNLCQNPQQVGYLAIDSLFVGTVVGDFTHATETRPTPACIDSSAYTWQDLWYRLTAQAGDLVTLSLNTDSTMLAGIEVFGGDCGSSSMACSTDSTPVVLNVPSTGTYWIRVFSLESRSSANTFELHITQEHTTAIHEETFANVRIYPNPGNGNFSLIPHFNAANATIAVMDMAGRTVHSEQASLHRGSVLELSLQGSVKAGSYLLEVTSPAGRSVTRLLVN